MTDNWASMPLVDDNDSAISSYRARPKYHTDTGIVIHEGDNAYFPVSSNLDNQELLEQPDVHMLTDIEVKELEERLAYPLPSIGNEKSAYIGNKAKRVGLGDLIAMGLHKLGIAECTGCRKRRRWLNKIPVRWQRRK